MFEVWTKFFVQRAVYYLVLIKIPNLESESAIWVPWWQDWHLASHIGSFLNKSFLIDPETEHGCLWTMQLSNMGPSYMKLRKPQKNEVKKFNESIETSDETRPSFYLWIGHLKGIGNPALGPILNKNLCLNFLPAAPFNLNRKHVNI